MTLKKTSKILLTVIVVVLLGSSLAKQRLENVMKSLVPFFVAIFISLMLVTYIPALSEWLPTTLGLM